MSFLDQSRGVRVRVRAYTFSSPLSFFLISSREKIRTKKVSESHARERVKKRERGRERARERARREKVIRIVVRIVIEKYRTATTTTSWRKKEKRKGYGRRDERDENERL